MEPNSSKPTSTRRKSIAAVFSFSTPSDTKKPSFSGVPEISRRTSHPTASSHAKPNFSSIQFSDLLKEQDKPPIISVPPSTKISDALELMEKNKILSLPITSRTKKNKFIAIISTDDLLHYILSKSSKKLDRSLAETILKQSVESLLTLDPEDESYRIWERDYRDTLERTIIAFAQGCHRAIITDALELRPPTILTQTDIILEALSVSETHAFSVDILAPLSASVPECIRKVVSMTTSETALDGFLRLHDNKMAALPILKDSQLIATLSKSDLMGLNVEILLKMHLPVLEFLDFADKNTDQIVCTPGDSLKTIMDKMIENRVHRLWIVSSLESMTVIGVISQSDVLAALIGVNYHLVLRL